jgi:hypothetical protein
MIMKITKSKYHKEKQFKCDICHKDFNKKRQLKSHIKDAHPNSKK